MNLSERLLISFVLCILFYQITQHQPKNWHVMFGVASYFTVEMGRKENGGGGATYNPSFYVVGNAIAKCRGVVSENVLC